MMRGRLALLPVLVSAACSKQEGVRTTAPSTLHITSTAFADGASIPAQYTCDGANISPPLSWDVGGAPFAALVVDDPDAPRGTYVHWVVVDIPAGVTSSAENAAPSGGVQVKNSAGKPSWTGPCPPSGTHHYRFTIYALPAVTGLDAGASLDAAIKAIDANASEQGRLTGTYHRGG